MVLYCATGGGKFGRVSGDLSLAGVGAPGGHFDHSDKLVTIFGIRITEWTFS